jgi:hypothetical protein
MPDEFDKDLEVVWNGEMKAPLLPPRETKPDLTWEPPRRLYNRKPAVVTVEVSQKCERCGGEKPVGQSCGCFDNNSQ